MENTDPEIKKKRTKRVMLFSLGTLALGTLTFFGIKHFTKPKNDNPDDTNDQEGDGLDNEKTVSTPAYTKPHTSLPAPGSGTTFPLRLGAKGDKVLSLQQALIRSYGTSILPGFGADGQFGSELATALRSKGYGIPLSEADYGKITQEKKQETPNPLVAFDPAAVAKGIFYAIRAKDFNTALILMKSIRNTTDYSSVSRELMNYWIDGVRKTLVNAVLSTFTESSQHAKMQDALKAMGLKYDGTKWTTK